MGLFDRVRGWLRDEVESDVEAAPRAPAPSVPTASDVERARAAEAFAPLADVGRASGPTVEVAIALLRRARATAHEAAAVQLALDAMAERPVPEAIRVACADILAARGDERGALGVLAGCTSTAGLVLAADLFAGSGQLPRAVGAIERVLARDLGAPGARERQQRWSAALGYARKAPARARDEATIVGADRPSGPFRLLREAARGGAGVVYEAEDDALGRRVAFKVYHGRSADRALLERESRLAVQLAGPGIVRIFDADPKEGWVALEWVSRGSIRDRLRAGDLEPLSPVGRWARPLARALARVHAAGFVHADIKPGNILLRQPGDPVLADFGIARRLGAPGGGGSPGYISPERLGGRASDPRDDMYAFGRVLEDVLHLFEARGAEPPDAAQFRDLALRCIGPDEERPDATAAI